MGLFLLKARSPLTGGKESNNGQNTTLLFIPHPQYISRNISNKDKKSNSGFNQPQILSNMFLEFEAIENEYKMK